MSSVLQEQLMSSTAGSLLVDSGMHFTHSSVIRIANLKCAQCEYKRMGSSMVNRACRSNLLENIQPCEDHGTERLLYPHLHSRLVQSYIYFIVT